VSAALIRTRNDQGIIKVLFIGCERSARVNDHAAELNGQSGGRTVWWFERMRREDGKLALAIYTGSNAAKLGRLLAIPLPLGVSRSDLQQ
jgi:hypothetical protein